MIFKLPRTNGTRIQEKMNDFILLNDTCKLTVRLVRYLKTYFLFLTEQYE